VFLLLLYYLTLSTIPYLQVMITHSEEISPTTGQKRPLSEASGSLRARKAAKVINARPTTAVTLKYPSLHDLSAAATSDTPTSMHDLSPAATNDTPTSMNDLSPAATNDTLTSMHDLSLAATNGKF
jgi:hypothetical protein